MSSLLVFQNCYYCMRFGLSVMCGPTRQKNSHHVILYVFPKKLGKLRVVLHLHFRFEKNRFES